ncbi:MAG: peptidoglycan-associated lipoprotein Pal [Wenzhouxiangellaceae bacterium]|jgi:peptidoglycan-associated lipoprotein|nr:peptidoglycan-associated lipoprotein Pal [Wenzhouxiangellaceae bacterium]MBS3746243.1 peptidoglycan-associated lipoprotein Pal [Wenzhouxiangellaceae bacterium]MBS3824534.1 peptidoglycan-associated lipoprotein Pal [Wenzhouxiangellaceae bacterium]
MNFALKFFLVSALAILLGACATDTRDVPAEPEPQPQEPSEPSEPVEVDRVNPVDFADSRNLDNPESTLSQREIYFEFDRSDVRAEYLPIIRAHAQYLKANPSARMLLEGHADERGSREYNLGLGERRGNSVLDLMQAEGASASQIEVVSYGEERPVCRQSSESCWERNRRVEIVYTAR